MNASKENKDLLRSSKETEKLKERLRVLFKQQEQKEKQKTLSTSFKSKEPQNHKHPHVSGKAPSKIKENPNTKPAINKHTHKINNVLNGAAKQMKSKVEDPPLKGKTPNGSLDTRNSPQVKILKKNLKSKTLPSTAKSQQITKSRQNISEKQSKHVGAIPIYNATTEKLSRKVENTVTAQNNKSKVQKDNGRKRANTAAPVVENKKPKLTPKPKFKNKSKNRARKQNNGMKHNNLENRIKKTFFDSDLSEDDSFDLHEAEEEENYSDFDEEDYEEESSIFDLPYKNIFSASEDDYSDIFGFNNEESDTEYKLPDYVPEDLIIHSGTAIKRDLLPEDNVVFEDNFVLQVIELENQEPVKVIQQPKQYQRDELLKLMYTKSQAAQKISNPFSQEEYDICPTLVPINDVNRVNEEPYGMEDKGFISNDEDDLYQMIGSEYSEILSEDEVSLQTDDINDKYLYRDNWTPDFDSCDDEIWAAQDKPEVIDATNCTYSAGKTVDDEEKSLAHDKTVSQYMSKISNVANKADIITIRVIDNIYFEKNDLETEETFEDVRNANTPHPSIDVTEKYTLIDSANAQLSVDNISSTSDSEACENACKQFKLSANRLKNTAQSLTDYSTIFCCATNTNFVLVLLKDPFYIYGTVRLTLLAGEVEVYGHSLTKGIEVELFSPRGCSEIKISSKITADKDIVTKDKLAAVLKKFDPNFLKMDIENIVNFFDPQKDAILLLKRNEERKKLVQQFKKFMNENVFPNLQNITFDRPLYDTEYLLRCMINVTATEHKCLRIPEQWHHFDVENYSRVMLVGGKAVGKSTLLRFLINKHLNKYDRVVLIDLDIGQPELFVPQTVSCSIVQKPLLGPGFFLNLQPDKSYVVGNTNIAMCPHRYIEAVTSLIDYCRQQASYQNIPWFINTMGYNRGFGQELISVIARQLPLTDVIQLQSNKPINNFENILYPQVVGQTQRNMFVDDVRPCQESLQELNYRLCTWQSAVVQESRYQKEWSMSPKDMRYANMLTRLSLALQGHAEWLSDCTPISVPLDKLILINLMDETQNCSPDMLAKAMEANLVYLCHCQAEISSVECLGIGVVKAIDFHVRQLYLVPAVATSAILNSINCLALGEMPLPSSLLTNQGSRVQNTAPFVYNTIEAKASKAIKQIYHRPTKFLKGKQKPFD